MGEGNQKGDNVEWAKCMGKTVVRLLVQILGVVAKDQLVCACSKQVKVHADLTQVCIIRGESTQGMHCSGRVNVSVVRYITLCNTTNTVLRTKGQ